MRALGAALICLAGIARASTSGADDADDTRYVLQKTYDTSNFFDEFNFFEVGLPCQTLGRNIRSYNPTRAPPPASIPPTASSGTATKPTHKSSVWPRCRTMPST
jgi:hypothetical protein